MNFSELKEKTKEFDWNGTEDQTGFADKISSTKAIAKELFAEGYNLGLIPKKDLIIGSLYGGYCRNTSSAVWNGTAFEFYRWKFGFMPDDIKHIEDDDGYDVFLPFERLEDVN